MTTRQEYERAAFKGRTKKVLENEFLALITSLSRCPVPERQVYFAKPRRWRFDFSWPGEAKVAVEIQGGIFSRGRHTRGLGYHQDCDKANAAIERGWYVLRFTVLHIDRDPIAMIEQLERVLRLRGVVW